MKKIITLLVLLVIILSAAQAQIPNASFENWTTTGGYSTPDGWDNFNPLTATASVYTCEKGTTGVPHGSSFIMLTTKVVGSSTVPGLAMSGKYNIATKEPESGFAYTGRPSHLTGKWQYSMLGADTGRVGVIFTKWNTTTNKRDLVAEVEYDLTGAVTSWTSFAIPITYIRGFAPDTAIIGLVSSNKGATAGTYLYIDSLNFTGNVPNNVTDIEGMKYNVSLSPNPATGNFSVDFGIPVTGDVSAQIIDMFGKVVAEAAWEGGKRTYSMGLNNVVPGIYFVKLNVGEEVQTVRLVVE